MAAAAATGAVVVLEVSQAVPALGVSAGERVTCDSPPDLQAVLRACEAQLRLVDASIQVFDPEFEEWCAPIARLPGRWARVGGGSTRRGCIITRVTWGCPSAGGVDRETPCALGGDGLCAH
jgi:hypothetical protein